MAESVETPISKRRNRSSNSSTNDSPDTKKHRSSQNYSEEHYVEEDGEPPLATLNIMPSKDIQKTLQEILEKLGKLDIIESSVYKLQATLLDLETRTKTLEGFQHKASKDINDLQESLSFTVEKYITNLANVDEKQENISLKIATIEEAKRELTARIKDLETKNLYLEAYSRRENIKFENIKEFEEGSDKENTEHVLRLFMETELGFVDASSVEIQRVHRLGKKKENEPRPILARFLRYKDFEKILSHGRRLKDSNYKMYQDLPYEIVQRRKRLMATFKKAKANKIPAAFSKAQPDKLFVRGKLWPERKILEIP